MPDLLVKLYTLPSLQPDLDRMHEQGITLRRVIPPEKHFVVDWTDRNFNTFWASECDVAIHRTPPACWIATEQEQMIGFACYDATYKGFFGPTGVSEAARGRGVGKALLLACLHSMHWDGYAYAIIGAAGPVDFYQKCVGATVIEGSVPGIYAGMLRK